MTTTAQETVQEQIMKAEMEINLIEMNGIMTNDDDYMTPEENSADIPDDEMEVANTEPSSQENAVAAPPQSQIDAAMETEEQGNRTSGAKSLQVSLISHDQNFYTGIESS